MRPIPARSAIVTRISPDGATLARSGGAAIAVGATVVDGEALIIATPTGDGGGVTLDRRGVALRLTTARLPGGAGGGISAVNPFSGAAVEVAPSLPPANMGTAPAIKPGEAPRASRRILPIANEGGDK